MQYLCMTHLLLQKTKPVLQCLYMKSTVGTCHLRLSDFALPGLGTSLALTRWRAPQLHCTNRQAPATYTAFHEFLNMDIFMIFTPRSLTVNQFPSKSMRHTSYPKLTQNVLLGHYFLLY